MLAVLLATYVAVFLAEIVGDKLLYTTGILATRYRPVPIMIGMADRNEDELLATDFQSITLPEDLGLTLVKVHELISGKIANCQMEQRYIHKTGHTVWTSWSVSAANDTRSASRRRSRRARRA